MAVLSTLKHHGSYDRTCLIYDNLCLYITVAHSLQRSAVSQTLHICKQTKNKHNSQQDVLDLVFRTMFECINHIPGLVAKSSLLSPPELIVGNVKQILKYLSG